jgi:hypothetical protein
MAYFLFKILISALIVALISELSQRYSMAAATLASLPLVSVLAFIWIYLETKNTQNLIRLSYDIFWLVLPSLAFFIFFPALLKQGLTFWSSLAIACTSMALFYALMLYMLKLMH